MPGLPADCDLVGGLTVLVVLAHPDDESLACGGTIARLADAGARVVLLCASHGERGGRSEPSADQDQPTASVRATELREAIALLGVSRLVLLDHADGDIRWARVGVLRADIVMAIRSFHPAAVITFGEDGLYWHPDHVGLHERTKSAVSSFGGDAPALYYVTMREGTMPAAVAAAIARGWQPPSAGFWSLDPKSFGIAAAPPSASVDVAPWLDRKLNAIRAHRSQMTAGHPFADIGTADAKEWLGTEYFRRAPIEGSGRQVLELLG